VRVVVALFAFTQVAIEATGTAVLRVVGPRAVRVSDRPADAIDDLLRAVMTTVTPSVLDGPVVGAAWGITVPKI
jgi:hypothetical protein